MEKHKPIGVTRYKEALHKQREKSIKYGWFTNFIWAFQAMFLFC